MRLPAEWEAQQLVLFTFPQRDGDWGEQLQAASAALLAAANAVNEVTPVLMVVSDPEHFASFATEFKGEVMHCPTNDCWIRDYGPITVINKDRQPVFLDFTFNGWGGKFDAGEDNQFPQRFQEARFPEVERLRVDFVLEGGAIESDGMGSMLTTTQCLFSEGRNDWNDPELAEKYLQSWFGRKTDVYWLTDGHLIGDDTDAHIDTLARYLDERTIAYTSCADKSDPHFFALKEMWEDLKYLITPHNKPYKLLPLPLPPAIHGEDGHRLPATYANFLISNGTAFVPTYFSNEAEDHPGRAADAAAIAAFEKYGKYKVVAIDCRPFIEQHGSLHCLTMQVPKW